MQVTGGSVTSNGTDGRFSWSADSRWGSFSFQTHQRALGQPENNPCPWKSKELPALSSPWELGWTCLYSLPIQPLHPRLHTPGTDLRAAPPCCHCWSEAPSCLPAPSMPWVSRAGTLLALGTHPCHPHQLLPKAVPVVQTSPERRREPNPGPIPGAAGLGSLPCRWISCSLCASPAFCVVAPCHCATAAGTQRETPSAGDARAPVRSPPTAKPLAVPDPKTTAEGFSTQRLEAGLETRGLPSHHIFREAAKAAARRRGRGTPSRQRVLKCRSPLHSVPFALWERCWWHRARPCMIPVPGGARKPDGKLQQEGG